MRSVCCRRPPNLSPKSCEKMLASVFPPLAPPSTWKLVLLAYAPLAQHRSDFDSFWSRRARGVPHASILVPLRAVVEWPRGRTLAPSAHPSPRELPRLHEAPYPKAQAVAAQRAPAAEHGGGVALVGRGVTSRVRDKLQNTRCSVWAEFYRCKRPPCPVVSRPPLCSNTRWSVSCSPIQRPPGCA